MDLLLVIVWNVSQYAFISFVQRFRQSIQSSVEIVVRDTVSQTVQLTAHPLEPLYEASHQHLVSCHAALG